MFQTFLQLDELGDGKREKEKEEIIPVKDCYVKIDNVTAKWDEVRLKKMVKRSLIFDNKAFGMSPM